MEARGIGVRQVAGKSTADIVRQTKQEITSTVRVYRKEWMWESRHPTEEIAWAYFKEAFGGRLHPDDVRVEYDPELTRAPYFLLLRRWNVHTEWKDASLAKRHAELLVEEDPETVVEVVSRNSRREHKLKAYGVLKLPSS